MINFKNFEELSFENKYLIADFCNKIGEFLPIVDIEDYLLIKKYIRKILKIIEKEECNENKKNINRNC